ncbi:cinnamate beta-D-glucosyltransferase-like [Ananas comosus]|uniref:Glycosyltransferase n=1 Tax=Ananas comosus TaxID=4615 RepID=A0A6P5FXM6_ANACO|nr:cinnamate beta-D-glucosyltransferase-like [Ananas comosus]
MGEDSLSSSSSSSSAAAATSPHVLLIAFPGQGHVNPVLRLARRLAAKGLLVTFTSTSDIGARLLSSSSDVSPLPNFRFDFLSDQPSGPLAALDDLMRHLASAGPPSLAALLRRQTVPVTCVVGSPFLPWALDVAEGLGIPAAVLWVQSCAVFSAYYHYHHRLAAFPLSDSDPPVSLPGLPPLSAADVPSFLHPSNPYKLLADTILASFGNLGKARWLLANSFNELEHDAIAAFSSLRPLTPVGPLTDPFRGDLLTPADDCMSWLDAQERQSVAYVSVGSVVVLTADEMAEMAWGLRDSGRPFLWVVRQESRGLLPEDFLEGLTTTEGDVGRRGFVVGWSPQDRVLSHPAVGCFLTHCGWNSTLEALSAGLPVIAFPQWGDQVTNAKFLVDVYGVGVRRPEAEGMRARAAKWKEAAAAAVAEGGSSDRNIQNFADELRSIVVSGTSDTTSSNVCSGDNNDTTEESIK